jgi:hypothetical protein
VNSRELGDLVRYLFQPRVVNNAHPPSNLSILLASGTERQTTKELHRLYITFVRWVRSRSVRRILDALSHTLDAYDVREDGEETLIDATVLIRGGGAHLIPGDWRKWIVDQDRRWARDGFQLVDRRWVTLGVDSATVTVPQSGAKLEPHVDELIAALDVDDGPTVPQAVGTFPIASWTLSSIEQSLAWRIIAAGGSVLDRERYAGRDLVSGLRQIIVGLPSVEPDWENMDGLRQALLHL